MLLLIHGDNSFESEQTLKKELKNKDFDLIDASKVESLGQLIESQQNLSIFTSEIKLLVIKDLSRNRKKSLQNELATFLEKRKNVDVVIFESTKADARTKLFKIVKKHGKIIESKLLDQRGLVKWFREELKKREIGGEERIISRIIDKAGVNQNILQNEIEKLHLFLKAKDRKNVLNEDIEVVSQGDREIVIWDLVDSINNKDKVKTINLLNELMKSEKDFPYVSIMLAKQLKLLYLLKSKKISEDELTTEFKIHPYTISKAKSQLWKFDEKRLKMLYAKLTSLDFSYKQGRMDAKLGLIMLFASA